MIEFIWLAGRLQPCAAHEEKHVCSFWIFSKYRQINQHLLFKQAHRIFIVFLVFIHRVTITLGEFEMVIVGLSRNKDTLESVKTAVELAGGLGIKEGSTVLIRPNANTADPAPGSTNPEVLRGAIREVKRYNPGKIIVAEKSMTTMNTEEVLKKLGLWQVAEAEGVDEILTFDHMKREHVEPGRLTPGREDLMCLSFWRL